MSNTPTSSTLAGDVTMIGLGPMGQAMVRALLRGGHSVTVWNRTASRADSLVTEGATRATSPTEAIRSSPVVILSLTDYPAMEAVLASASPALSSTTAGQVRCSTTANRCSG